MAKDASQKNFSKTFQSKSVLYPYGRSAWKTSRVRPEMKKPKNETQRLEVTIWPEGIIKMKNMKTGKVNKFKNPLHPPDTDETTRAKECCSCCQFLKGWLARRKNRSEDDLAAALLIHLLWTTKNCPPGLCGVTFHPGDLDFLGIAVPDEALKGLQVLAKAGLVASYFAQATPANGDDASQSGTVPNCETLIVDLLWVEENQE